jgi:hypothetical protein
MINYPKLLFQKIKYKTRKLLKKINKLFWSKIKVLP